MGWDQPLGSPGLIEFDEAGGLAWSFAPPDGFDVIDDCYALNAVGPGSVWAYYYGSFPIVHVDGGLDNREVKGWATNVAGAHALAMHDDRAVLFGGYAPNRTRTTLGKLGADGLAIIGESGATAEGPDSIESLRVTGRGPVLHGFAGTRWYQFDSRPLAGLDSEG